MCHATGDLGIPSRKARLSLLMPRKSIFLVAIGRSSDSSLARSDFSIQRVHGSHMRTIPLKCGSHMRTTQLRSGLHCRLQRPPG
jgi:hypothetical protein